MIKGLVIGFVLGILVCVGAGYYYFASGMAPVAVSDPLMPFERKMANMALDAHIEKEHIGQPSVPADQPNLLAGAEIYVKNCATCHGSPGHEADYLNMMFPKPTQLFKGTGVTDDPASESYWKAANGIRLSGMPAFKNKLTSTQLWQVSDLIAHANELPDLVKSLLVSNSSGSASSPSPTSQARYESGTQK